jgi:indolepyruvate ferredoxin oxidoreductase beta subunit
MSADRGNILIAGVGGQGILLASEVLGEAFLRSGSDVKKSEVHGMAQRGGSVTTHLRYGPKVFSPLIEPGTADLLLAFEKIEALRFAHFLAPQGVAIVNTQEIYPASVATGREAYPADTAERLRAVTGRLFLVDALGAALTLQAVRAVNVVMVGAASHFLPFPPAAYEEALRARMSERMARVNIQALRAGRDLIPAEALTGAGTPRTQP